MQGENAATEVDTDFHCGKIGDVDTNVEFIANEDADMNDADVDADIK